MTKLWISPALELRHSVNGWPEKPDYKIPPTDTGALQAAADHYFDEWEKALAKAKEESILVDDVLHIRQQWKADTFIDYDGVFEIITQYRTTPNGRWFDYYSEGIGACETRQVARLKREYTQEQMQHAMSMIGKSAINMARITEKDQEMYNKELDKLEVKTFAVIEVNQEPKPGPEYKLTGDALRLPIEQKIATRATERLDSATSHYGRMEASYEVDIHDLKQAVESGTMAIDSLYAITGEMQGVITKQDKQLDNPWSFGP